MELKLLQEKEQLLLSRKELILNMDFENATPSNSDVAKALALQFKSSEDLVVVKQILTGFGVRNAKVKALIYSNPEAKKSFEPKVKEKKSKEGAPAK